MNNDLKEVTKEEFYKKIGPLDVVSNIIGEYPYTHIYKLRNNRKEIGRIVGSFPEGKKWPEIEKFFLI